jgi:hypothetical protein
VNLSRTIASLCRLKRDLYADFSVRHFYEQVAEKHALKVSYNQWVVANAAGSRQNVAQHQAA